MSGVVVFRPGAILHFPEKIKVLDAHTSVSIVLSAFEKDLCGIPWGYFPFCTSISPFLPSIKHETKVVFKLVSFNQKIKTSLSSHSPDILIRQACLHMKEKE